ncbi:MAG: hypothetical protein H7Y61_04890 [Rhizobiales bacterium]|nr:hypothetical protein [Rhizobacter sp.]
MTDRMERYLETMMPVPGSPSYAEVAQGLEKANAKIADLETRLAAHAEKERARSFMATAI